MTDYQQHCLEGASAVDLVIALYEGMIRFLYAAAEASDRGDVESRRASVKRALDIIIHLQARLRMDIGGRPAKALSEFYVAIFATILQASQSASRPKFDHAIACIRTVRDAWKRVAVESGGRSASAQVSAPKQAVGRNPARSDEMQGEVIPRIQLMA
jgi:flagellar protein FliS